MQHRVGERCRLGSRASCEPSTEFTVMGDSNNSREQLTRELESLRRRVAELQEGASEAERSLRELRRIERDKAIVLEHVSDLVTYRDREMRTIWATKSLADCLGCGGAEEVVGRVCYRARHGRDTPCPDCMVLRVLETGRRQELDTRSPDGKCWRVTCSPVRDESGAIIGTVEVSQDITERARADAAREESEERFRTMAESIQDGLTIVEQGHVVYVNDRLSEILGLSKEKLLEMTSADFAAPEERARLRRVMQQAQEAGDHPSELEFWIVRPDGSRRRIQNRYSLSTDGERLIARYIVTTDVTEARRTERELHASLERLRELLQETVNSLASAIELRDPYTAGHQRGVAQLACAIADEMRLPEDRAAGLRMAALVHDIGKISVPAEILSKPGSLTETQFGLVRSHPETGWDVLKSIPFPWPVAETVLQHHERIDGSGYPRGLCGDEIILEARILAVADVVEAVTSHRPYRQALDIDEALSHISENRGLLYDAPAVDACLRLFREKDFSFQRT
jgi:PAS domain S-box-containing protein